ncbi:MAG: hypothetical protein ABA06_00480 [Parcubacteria bacterium C7867-001]|nr:MAG: hypothetical protein ABA06_00480 [Parcubacteria bacterium C7867-001]
MADDPGAAVAASQTAAPPAKPRGKFWHGVRKALSDFSLKKVLPFLCRSGSALVLAALYVFFALVIDWRPQTVPEAITFMTVVLIIREGFEWAQSLVVAELFEKLRVGMDENPIVDSTISWAPIAAVGGTVLWLIAKQQPIDIWLMLLGAMLIGIAWRDIYINGKNTNTIQRLLPEMMLVNKNKNNE